MTNEPPSVRLRLAENMRRLRHERAWSQEDLAAKAQLHRNQIGAMERGKNSVGIDIIDRIALTFGVSIGELLD
ncbi:helix-turn-helix domain-containing protein [Deinococcus oregonensis]|uniref:Helix-turn-helix domain-containing protein n=1 Tax=Deinococcus oregonensis TaxID=1805970 RepID=A0ABV6B241_9DEIO|nr:helix-turn-helix transcriptional regulator [Deinococcus aquatilis]